MSFKQVLKISFVIALIAGILFSINFYIKTNTQSVVSYETETATYKTIENKTVATGMVIPEDEVEIKPQLSGILDELFVEEGALINTGDLIAKIKVIPNEAALINTQGRVKNQKIILDNATINFERTKKLYNDQLISKHDYDNAELAWSQAKQNLENAKNDLQIIKEGTAGGGTANTNIRATVSGMILEIPIEEGDQVIESNNFNPGSTIATIADLTKMIFEGWVDEADVSKLSIGMPLEISLAAIENKSFDAKLRFIAAKGHDRSGTVQFKIKGELFLDEGFFVRAGYSANASIVLQKEENVLAIREALLRFDDATGKPYVEVETSEQQFERRDLTLGISDGLVTQVLSGIDAEDKIKVWNKTESKDK